MVSLAAPSCDFKEREGKIPLPTSGTWKKAQADDPLVMQPRTKGGVAEVA